LAGLRLNGMILVGHSFGGFIIRLLATLRTDVIGMVLVDASHEDHLRRFEGLGGGLGMPRGNNFVIEPSSVPENLSETIKRKIRALGRMRKTYAATHGEMSAFRESGRQVSLINKKFDFPVIVLARGMDLLGGSAGGDQKSQIWMDLQKELANISKRGSLIVAENSGHHVHIDEPGLVRQAITQIADTYEGREP